MRSFFGWEINDGFSWKATCGKHVCISRFYLFTWLCRRLCPFLFSVIPLQTAFFEFASAIGTVGLSVGVTTATAPAGQLWVEIRDCGNAAWALWNFS